MPQNTCLLGNKESVWSVTGNIHTSISNEMTLSRVLIDGPLSAMRVPNYKYVYNWITQSIVTM